MEEGSPDFEYLSWDEAKSRLIQLPLTKFCDFNIKNLIHGFKSKNTFEVRILPGLMEAKPVLEAIHLFSHIFSYVQEHDLSYHAPKTHIHRQELLSKIGYPQIEHEE